MSYPVEVERVAAQSREREPDNTERDPIGVRIELQYVAGCPNVDSARRLLRTCIAGLNITAKVIEVEGDWPSPTIRVNGVDVMGAADGEGAFCRLDLPTRERLIAALEATK